MFLALRFPWPKGQRGGVLALLGDKPALARLAVGHCVIAREAWQSSAPYRRNIQASANHAKQVMLVGIFNRHLHNIPRRQCGWHIAQIDIAVNFRRIGL